MTPTGLALPAEAWYIGLMSGTSLDGVDAVVARFGAGCAAIEVAGHQHLPFPAALRAELLALNTAGENELHRAALAANQLARVQAEAVHAVLGASGLPPAQIHAVGSHGQTVRHRPGEFDGVGYTLQLNQPALLAELCGIDVVADFRSRDVAAGGQGAPLVPAFHAQVFAQAGQARAVLNIGGISNLTLLPADGAQSVRGFDCGPGNALLDHGAALHLGQAYDAGGAWGARGQVDEALLQALMAEPFLSLPPPKSTGRDLFNPAWLAQRLAPFAGLRPVDVQASLAEFTARAAASALRASAPETQALYVCGGGVFNLDVMRRLQACLPGVQVGSTEALGLPPMQVEAAAFAWLARAHCCREPGQRTEVTGARGLRILGALYPA
ncbi:anhydro-N-acetylmuramic acid kinase [Ideonella paludis]|uniref:anhydro-N-acetylmuramic acid kinase n=1 Tax=Ideonella paludis TaxID=1233411 RepID=UPI002174F1D3|nr:anhydro-N-acetylmuramic acid kinase [Ideonella paludis]